MMKNAGVERWHRPAVVGGALGEDEDGGRGVRRSAAGSARVERRRRPAAVARAAKIGGGNDNGERRGVAPDRKGECVVIAGRASQH